jgi:hypothetical protein
MESKKLKWTPTVHYNKMAFDEVFGSHDDPGTYIRFKSNNVHNVTMYTGGTSTRNPATPCRSDFCCDVDNLLKVVLRGKLLERFFNHYILGVEELNQEQKTYIEQTIGLELRKRNLVPVNNYFKVRRK